jgi:hypothetical protein
VGFVPGVIGVTVGVGFELVADEPPKVGVTEVTMVGVGGRRVVVVLLAGVPVLPLVAGVVEVEVDEPGPSDFFDTSPSKPGLAPCAKSWYQWPMLSWMPKDEVLLDGVSGGTVENA